MGEPRIDLPYYSLKQAAKIIGCTKSDLMILSANRMARIHVLTGGRAHWFDLDFDENDRLVKFMKALPEICLVPFEFWARREAGEDCSLNSLTSVDSKNLPDGIGDVLYSAPWHDYTGKVIELTRFVVLPDELYRLKQVLRDGLMQAEAETGVDEGTNSQADAEPASAEIIQDSTVPNEIELTQWLRQTWNTEQMPGGTKFFGKLKKYVGMKGSPIIEHYGAGTEAGFKWRTSKGSEGEMKKSTLLNKVSKFKKTP